ncbi:PhnA protein [Aquimarina sp. AD1]|uniref:PhnA domain-containing protein n=1 Tax=Aquimarina sp. (strain AD1) TaxID=1714848 RepID=UPI000E508383|nr:alkylphosphonate utilization protein [Aquimarina sp. AD1]AXT54969.1 PhnA protein [Aquimarina sp. AD1]RKN20571.1 PhnA protein [Aquimarina sp. AD1]
MSKLKELQDRSHTTCELCGATDNLSIYDIPESPNVGLDSSILICSICKDQIENVLTMNPNHWRCLNDSMWSQAPGVQVMAYRMLHRLKSEGWPQDLIDMLYLDDDTLAWAKATGEGDDESTKIKHLDSNGALLNAGDNVVLIKDLNVKGANFTAKRGTAVRNISLVHDNPEHIEGKVSGQHIVILTKFVKKS